MNIDLTEDEMIRIRERIGASILDATDAQIASKMVVALRNFEREDDPAKAAEKWKTPL